MYSRFFQLFTISAVAAATFEWDCTNSLGTCNNACYAVNHGLSPGVLTYDSDANNRDPRRTASGCNRTPCSNTGYSQWGNSCDEYPFASVQEGGNNAILRCVDSTENSSKTKRPTASDIDEVMFADVARRRGWPTRQLLQGNQQR